MNETLLRELKSLREELRATTLTDAGNNAIVCSDKALMAIAENEPRNLSEMSMLDGVGKDFTEKYGDQFLEVLDMHRQRNSTTRSVRMDDRKIAIMKELEKNLVDIGRRNKLLFLAKSSPKHSQDLYSTEYDIRDLIFGKKNRVIISDRASKSKNYAGFSSVIREANRDLREKGKNDLYIGYPFVKGRLIGEGFEVRAPLMLIPVKADRRPDTITLSLDPDRDAMFNNTLILAYHKHNSVRRPLPDPFIDEYAESTFIQDIVQYYAKENIIISAVGNYSELWNFMDYLSGQFPKYREGELLLENCATLGKFTMQTSSIHRDYDEMLSTNEINELINNLLEGFDGDEDTFIGDYEIKGPTKDDVLERDLVYINTLNGSQERVLRTIDTCDEVVIHGPPGTGKSQTIASLIVDSVNKNKTVLMVSEKKTALDVIHSRLGILSKFAFQIDDVGDKERFYSKIDDMMNSPPSVNGRQDIDTVSMLIDNEIERLEDIARSLYTPDSLGIEPYKLFRTGYSIDDSSDVEYKIYSAINADPGITSMTYPDLNGSFRKFATPGVFENAIRYIDLKSEYPILTSFGKSMNRFDMRTMKDQVDRLSTEIDSWKRKFFLLRMFGKGAIRKKTDDFVSTYLPLGDKQATTDTIVGHGLDFVKEAMDRYEEFQIVDNLHSSLTDQDNMYLLSMLKVKAMVPECTNINEEFYKLSICWHIEDYRKRNRHILASIDEFNDIVAKIGKLTERKRELSIKHTEAILREEFERYILNPETKAGKEIRRRVESKRKKNVGAFMKLFSAQLFNGIKIWLMTPEVVSEIIPFEKGRFDLVIFDEASQMYREKGLPAIYRAKKVVIAGDDKQLRPSSVGKGRFDVNADEDADLEMMDAILEEVSLLDLAKSKYTPVLLDYHYRSRYEELINFSNYAFYRAKLYVSPNTGIPEVPPIQMHIVKGTWVDRTNMAEAKKVVKLIKEFFDKRRNNETIGVITFNITQRDLIERMLEEECVMDPSFDIRYRNECDRKENGEDVGLFIRSIENVQGDERDEIVFSIAYAKDSSGRFRRNFGSLSMEGGENRLNVAVTRAKKRIQIVTSMDPSEFNVSGIDSKGPVFLKKYLEYSQAVSNGNYEKVRNILQSFHDDIGPGSTVDFDSEFEEQVYDRLRNRGLSVDTQIGVGGYRIDLAVKINGRYVLGIECDGKMYHNSTSARERDYHRQKYLESRGWKIYRIWSTNWWNNSNLEVERIVSLVNANM